jgi:hypothetical protein
MNQSRSDNGKLRVLDLFSGIGGFSLGLERTGGFRTVAFCEVNEFCRRILRKHWPGVPILEDVTRIGIEPISCAEGSHVRTLVTPAEAPVLPAPVLVSGVGYAVPFAWFDPYTRSWRTWQRCLTEGWAEFSETWPRSGMTRNGIAYQLPTLAFPTLGIASGLLPTIGANESKGSQRRRYRTSTEYRGAKMSEGLRSGETDPIYTNPGFAEQAMGYEKDWTLSETPSSRKSPKSSAKRSSRQKRATEAKS